MSEFKTLKEYQLTRAFNYVSLNYYIAFRNTKSQLYLLVNKDVSLVVEACKINLAILIQVCSALFYNNTIPVNCESSKQWQN